MALWVVFIVHAKIMGMGVSTDTSKTL